MKITPNSLGSLAGTVSLPVYERSSVSPGILHIGVGNFHRAHQAVYLDNLFAKGLDLDWGIMGAGVMPYDTKMRKLLAQQDWLSTVIELDPNGYNARVVGAMIAYADVSGASLVQALSKPEIRIVSMTITEGGYFLEQGSGSFNSDHPDIIADAVSTEPPRTVFGALVKALAIRRAKGIAPFTIMSCDNVPENGHVTRQAVLGLAEMVSGSLASWILENVSFPSGMVDCITPATGDRERQMAYDRFGIEDEGLVVCEPYRHWVLEDSFIEGRPALEEVGVKFVSDVGPYEQMKLRIVNGGHAAIAYPSALMGIEYAHEAMQMPLVRQFLHKLEAEEIIPTLPKVNGIEFQNYLGQTMDRFSNAEVGDTVARLCLDGSNRQPKFILPAIEERLSQGSDISGLSLEVALWCRYCSGRDEEGNTLHLVDENAERLRDKARLAQDNPQAFLDMPDIFGSLAENKIFAEKFSEALRSIWEKGTSATLETYLAKGNSK
ncbi:MAG: mannitol dehydrogenase family protein [Proteobacteria bacterium]|nr:mannitol dehydrogenase family protein [Pseudomonadota bacterium]